MTEKRRDKLITMARTLSNRKHITLLELQRFCGVAGSLLLAAPCLKIYLGVFYTCGATERNGEIRVTLDMKRSFDMFSEENIMRWSRIARWCPDDHVSALLTGLSVRLADGLC